MTFFQPSQADTFAKAAAVVTLTLLVWAVVRYRWFAQKAESADENKLGALLVAVSAVVITIVFVAAMLGPHPS